MRITIPDDLADDLQVRLPRGRTLEEDIVARLSAQATLNPPHVVLGGTELAALESALGLQRPLRSWEDLLAVVRLLARVEVGRIVVDWTPEQLVQLEDRARRAGYSLPEFLGQVVHRLVADVFQVAPPADGSPSVVVLRDRIWTAEQVLAGMHEE